MIGPDAPKPDQQHGRRHGVLEALITGATFLTRLPVGRWLSRDVRDGPSLAEAAWTMPIIGAFIGLAGGMVFYVALSFHVSAFAAALLALGTSMAITGALHEDGLADCADGLGAILAAGADRAAALDIMRDSRIGTFGVLALILGIGLRVAALADLTALTGIAALIAAHAAARGLLPLAMHKMIPARADGMAVHAGRPSAEHAWAAVAIGAAAALVLLGPSAGALALLAAAGAAWALATLARRRLGGYTGDVLGAIEQLCEAAMLIMIAAIL